MTNEVTVEIKLDADLKAAAEKLYGKIHLTLEEAIPLLVKYNVEQDTKPFDIPSEPEEEHTELFGTLSKYANPALIPFESGAWERAVVKKSAAGALSAYANPALIPFESCLWERAAVERYRRSLD